MSNPIDIKEIEHIAEVMFDRWRDGDWILAGYEHLSMSDLERVISSLLSLAKQEFRSDDAY